VDIKTILGGLMSGGFETVFSTAIIAIGVLASSQGQRMQDDAFEDIIKAYKTPKHAFAQCLSDEKSTYVMALVKETLRFFPPLKLLPPRQTLRDFIFEGSVIPKDILVYMNAQAINRGMSCQCLQQGDKGFVTNALGRYFRVW